MIKVKRLYILLCHKARIQRDNKNKLLFGIENFVLLYLIIRCIPFLIYAISLEILSFYFIKNLSTKNSKWYILFWERTILDKVYYAIIINRSQCQSLNYNEKNVKVYCFENLVIKGEKII